MLNPEPTEVWVELHYRYKGEFFQFNLPLKFGEKFLDGLRLDFGLDDIEGGRRLRLMIEPLGKVELETVVLTGSLPFGSEVKSVFVNGYQSATGSRERSPGERISALDWPGRFIGMHLPGDARFYPYSEKKGRFHGYSYAYIRYPDGLVFTGSLDESAGFTIISMDVRKGLFSISKDVAGLVVDSRRSMLDLVILDGDEEEVFQRYRTLREDKVKPGPRAVAWTSGRDNRGTLDEVKVRRSLAAVRSAGIPLNYFIVDDGWQSHTGDWGIPASGFPSGMASLAAEIRGSGYTPGLRFAPFVVGMESSIFRNHKEWLARDSRGRIRPAVRTRKPGGILFALDLSHEGARDHITASVARFRDDWGFGMIRADHLHAAAVYPPKGSSRGEAMAKAMDFLSGIRGGLVLENSGVPVESAFGRGEYCRIAADTIPAWEDTYRRNIHARERASTLNALRSTVGRRHLDGLFFASSTDSFRLGDAGNSIEASRRYTQLLLQYLLGSLLSCSDDIEAYRDYQKAVFCSLFPVLRPRIESVNEFRRTVTVRYRAGDRQCICIANLAERHRNFVLPEGEWFGAPGLKRRPHHIGGGSRQDFKPGESRNYVLISDSVPEGYAGSDGHILPGSEISSITKGGDGWEVVPVAGILHPFNVWLRSEEGIPARINGRPAELVETPTGTALLKGRVDIHGILS